MLHPGRKDPMIAAPLSLPGHRARVAHSAFHVSRRRRMAIITIHHMASIHPSFTSHHYLLYLIRHFLHESDCERRVGDCRYIRPASLPSQAVTLRTRVPPSPSAHHPPPHSSFHRRSSQRHPSRKCCPPTQPIIQPSSLSNLATTE